MNPQTAAVLDATQVEDETDLTSQDAAEVDKQTDADMMASFASGDDEVTPTATPAESEEPPAEPDEKDTQATAATVEEPKVETPPDPQAELASVLQRFTTLEDLHKRSADGLNGRVGSLESILQAMKAAKPGAPLKVTLDDFGEFGKEYPHFANPQIEVINKALASMQHAQFSPEYTETLVNQNKEAAKAAAKEQAERDRLDAFNDEMEDFDENWQTLVGLPSVDNGPPPDTAYRRWLATQPEKYQTRMRNTFSATVLQNSIKKFQAYEAEQAKAKAPAPVKQTPKVATREQRLASAVTVKAQTSTPAVEKERTVEEDMMAAFKGKK